MRAAPSLVQIFDDGPATPVLAFNDSVPGPVIRAKRGERVRVRVINDLDEPTTVHWHGVRIDNAMDGVPDLTQKPIAPGESFDYDFVAPDAGTYWYHSHFRTYEQVDRGLYGALIIEEPEPIGVDRDIWLVFDDWRLLPNNCIDLASYGDRREWAREGRIGNTFTVNGKINPVFPIKRGERVRLRCVNACNAMSVSFDMFGLPLQTIAYDGQTLVTPIRRINSTLSLWPGQRIDFVVDVTREVRETVALRRYANGEATAVATFQIVGDTPPDAARQPLHLLTNDLPEPDLANLHHVELLLQGGSMATRFRGARNNRQHLEDGQFWTINGESGGPYLGFGKGKPLFDVARGQTVAIEMINDTFFTHAMHFHGHHVRVIARDGVALGDQPWRDVEAIRPDEHLTVAMVADNPGSWIYHCHMAEHHAAGMGGWFKVRA
jgi:FtsP/CotA-like multicopper oxidase with cupredoxin domain